RRAQARMVRGAAENGHATVVAACPGSQSPADPYKYFPKKLPSLSILLSVVRRVSRGWVQLVETDRKPSSKPKTRRRLTMRVMVFIKANKDSEAGVMPSEQILTDMGKFNEELVKAGVMLAGEGLYPSSKGKRARFSGGKRTVIDGPFTETKELIAGFWL